MYMMCKKTKNKIKQQTKKQKNEFRDNKNTITKVLKQKRSKPVKSIDEQTK